MNQIYSYRDEQKNLKLIDVDVKALVEVVKIYGEGLGLDGAGTLQLLQHSLWVIRRVIKKKNDAVDGVIGADEDD
jgi:hypothetical protein